MPRYEITDPEGSRTAELVDPVATFGRSRRCTIRLHDPVLSRVHFEVRLAEDGWWLKDLGSRNQTFLNGQPVCDSLLKTGDRIEVGKTSIVFTADEGPVPAPPPPASPRRSRLPWILAALVLGGTTLLIVFLYLVDEEWTISVGGIAFHRGTTEELNKRVGIIIVLVMIFHLLIYILVKVAKQNAEAGVRIGAAEVSNVHMHRALWLLVLLLLPQEKKVGLSEAEKKEVYALAQEYLDAKTWEDKLKVSVKLEAYRPSKSDIAALFTRCQALFKKSGPLQDGKSPATCTDPKHPGKYIITLPAGAKKGERVGLFISLHGGGQGVGDGSQIQGLFGVPGQGCINIYPTVCEKTDTAWNTEREEQYVMSILDELKRTYNIDTNHVYLAGHSMGGFGTWWLGGRHADLFAAISPMAGGVFIVRGGGGDGIEGGIVSNLMNTPIWFYHSQDDPQVGPEADIKASEVIQKLKEKYGPFDFVWKLYTDIGHGLPKDGVKPIFDWMMKKTRDPLPKRFLWESGRATTHHFYWLRRSDGGSLIEAKRDKNRITLTGSVRGVSVMLNEKMVDFSKPVVVEAEGKELFNDLVPFSAAAMVESFDSRHDPELTFSAWIKLPE